MKNSITALSSAVDLEFGDWFLLLGLPNKIQIFPVRDMDRFHGKKKINSGSSGPKQSSVISLMKDHRMPGVGRDLNNHELHAV